MKFRTGVMLASLGWLLATGCGPNSGADDGGDGGDGGPSDCDPLEDDDADCLSNALEGCELSPPPDRDSDGLPDYFDADSDNDGIPDMLEAGDCADPRDTDGDGMPDYVDTDSDNDGALDENEDRDGDGVIGECTTTCTSQDECSESEHCSLPPSGLGACVSPACLGGETDPHNDDTDGDGTPDGQEGTFICNPPGEMNPNGLKPIKYIDSSGIVMYAQANWRVAVEVAVEEGIPAINTPNGTESVYMLDLPGPEQQVAGFLASRTTSLPTAVEESTAAISAIQAMPAVSGLIVRVSGTNGTSLDGFDTVLATTLQVTTSAPTDVTALRAALYAALLGRDGAEVFVPTPIWSGETDTEFVIVFQTLHRTEDAQVVYMGAVTRRADFDDRTKATGIHADDLANGTGLAESDNGEAIECEQFVADQQATADIVWVVDDSGSMSDDQARVAGHAQAFFDKALSAGLDFRVGVTDMTLGRDGLFSTETTGGTGDFWILGQASEAPVFAAEVQDPANGNSDGGSEHGLHQARAAIERHMPRDDSDPQHFREKAKIVVIYVTDEKPDEIETGDPGPSGMGIIGEGHFLPSTAELAAIAAHIIGEWLPDFVMHDAVAHAIAVSLPHTEPDPCSGGGGETGWGYFDLVNATGGQIGSICQADLGATLDAIIDNILGDASPIVLSKIPISATIAVARDNIPIPRSRTLGFDYRAASNSIIFFNMPFDPMTPSDVVVSYRRWANQVPIE